MGEATARVGISGWTYAPWRGVFYPKGLPHAQELTYASSHVNSIEINGSFYSLQRPESWRRWHDSTPEDFVFSVKGPRFVTHLKRLSDIHVPLANFFASGVLALGSKLGPILWQLPARQRYEPELLEAFLSELPTTLSGAAELAADRDGRMAGREWSEPQPDRPLRHCVEVRHDSFDDERWYGMLERRGIANVVADTAGTWPQLNRETADFTYVRLHGDTELYASGYDSAALDAWAARVRRSLDAGRDAYVYFDNDMKVRAPVDAMALIERLGEVG